jgi:hypothetical protein
MTARVLQRLFVWNKTTTVPAHPGFERCLLWRAALATLFSHALAWLITSAMPQSLVLESSRLENFFRAAKAGLDW